MALSTGSDSLINAIPILGLTLVLCLLIGNLSKKIGLPKVSGYIILGIILGPEVFNHIPHDFTVNFKFFNDMALGLILFNIGGEFNKSLLKKMQKEQLLHSLLVCAFIVVFVFIFFFIISSLTTSLSNGHNLILSLFLALLSVEAAPPTTLLVIKEYSSEGKLSETIKIYLAFATMGAVIGTLILTKVLGFFSIWPMNYNGQVTLFLEAFWNIAGSILFGIILGIFLSFFERSENKVGNIFFAIIATILFGQSIAHYLKIDSLLISLFLGFTVANASHVGENLHKDIKNFGGSVYALFFVLAGTHIKFGALLGSIGILGAGYIVSRISGIILSNYMSAKILKLKEDNVRKYMGIGVISHAGAALAIVTRVYEYKHPTTDLIFNIVISSIFIFELAGPVLLKLALFKSGEIESWNGKAEKTTKGNLSIKDTVSTFTKNITSKESENFSSDTIKDLVKRDVMAIEGDADLESIKEYLKGDHLIHPVVNKDHHFLGTLNMLSIQQLGTSKDNALIRAKDLIGEEAFIPLNANLKTAHDIFSMTQKEIMPVVNTQDRVLEGVILHKDILVNLDQSKTKLFST